MTLAAIESVTYADGHEQIERFAHSWAAVSAAKHAMGRRTEKDPSVSASSCYVCSKTLGKQRNSQLLDRRSYSQTLCKRVSKFAESRCRCVPFGPIQVPLDFVDLTSKGSLQLR